MLGSFIKLYSRVSVLSSTDFQSRDTFHSLNSQQTHRYTHTRPPTNTPLHDLIEGLFYLHRTSPPPLSKLAAEQPVSPGILSLTLFFSTVSISTSIHPATVQPCRPPTQCLHTCASRSTRPGARPARPLQNRTPCRRRLQSSTTNTPPPPPPPTFKGRRLRTLVRSALWTATAARHPRRGSRPLPRGRIRTGDGGRAEFTGWLSGGLMALRLHWIGVSRDT